MEKHLAEIVKFHDEEIIAIQVNGNVEIVFKFLVESLGLHFVSAVSGLKNDAILGAEHAIRQVQVGENQARKYLTLPIERVEGWLFSIQVSRVAPEIQEKLISYKKECYQVLHEHFSGKQRQITINSQERITIKEEMKQLNDELARLKKKLKKLERQDRDIHLKLCPTLFDHLSDKPVEAVSE